MTSRHRLFEDIPSEADECQGDNLIQPTPIQDDNNFNNSVTRSDLHKEHTASSTSLPMCTCCQHLFIKKNIQIFYEKNYDTENSVVKHFMSRRQILPNIVEYIYANPVTELYQVRNHGCLSI